MEPGPPVSQNHPGCTLPDLRGLTGSQRCVRQFDFPDVEALAKALASRLLEELGRSTLEQMRFRAVPRGGLFVLGYLSYFLDLKPHQFETQPDVPLVLVDDCSISGARFSRFRREHPGPIYFAHLLSHPALRERVRQEDQVLGCAAVADLADLAPTLFPEPAEYQAWRQRCLERVGGGRLWIGIPERIAFPWTEPDTILFDPHSGEAVPGWRLVSPDRCLNNRRMLELPLRRDVTPELRVPDPVAFHLADERVSLCDLRSEECFSLQGPAALMWRALAAYGDVEAAAEYVTTQYDVSPAQALADTRRFAARLLELGLLVPCPAGNSPRSLP